jgi:HEPN domain-containing protein
MTAADRDTTGSQARFEDAWEQYRSAIDRLEAGDARDACGKAWNATRAAAEAAVLAHNGDTTTTTHISSNFRRLSRANGYTDLPARYSERAQYLHIEGCYYGIVYDDHILELIRETDSLIRQTEHLAGV